MKFDEKDYEGYLVYFTKHETESYLLRQVEWDSAARPEYKQAAQDLLVKRGDFYGTLRNYREMGTVKFDPTATCICESLLWGHVNACPLNRKI